MEPVEGTPAYTVFKWGRWVQRAAFVVLVGLMIYGVLRWKIVRLPAGADNVRRLRPSQLVVVDRWTTSAQSFRMKDMVLYEVVDPRTNLLEYRVGVVKGLPGHTVTLSARSVETEIHTMEDIMAVAVSAVNSVVVSADNIFVGNTRPLVDTPEERQIPVSKAYGRSTIHGKIVMFWTD